MKKIIIKSDGTPYGTRVYAYDPETGTEMLMETVTKVEISPIVADSLVTARITFINVEINALADLVEPENNG